MSIFNRIELDVMHASELEEATELTVKYKFPAMVAPSQSPSEAIWLRGRRQGKHQIVTPVDWPKGDSYGMLKLRGLSSDAIDVEGFEILLTGGMKLDDTRREAKALTDFIKNQLSETVEVRFVLGAFQRERQNVLEMCKALLDVRAPAYIRTDHHLKLQVSKANTDTHNELIDDISSIVGVPIKLCGNISSVRTMTACTRAKRFAINLAQAKSIIKEYNQQPTQLKHMLDAE
jgi:hypothetical protein